MGSTRCRFAEEYKAQAVGFALDYGHPIVEVARNIGVHEITLGKWVNRWRIRSALSWRGCGRRTPS